MEKLIYSVLISLAVLFVLARLYTFYNGLTPAELGEDGMLSQCPKKPNCVCSEFPDDGEHYIEPIQLTDTDVELALESLMLLAEQAGGKIDHKDARSFSARFTTPLMGYVDDLQIRIDEDKALIHLRSASRLGHADFNVNRERVQRLKQAYAAHLGGA